MKHDLKTKNFERKAKRVYAVLACTAMVMMVTAVPALAADDPLAVVNNLSEFIFSLIRAIGLILLGFGILQVGLSLKSHDPSQRANGMQIPPLASGRENVKSETLSSSGLPAREIPRGTQHAGKGISQPVITLRLSAKMKSSA